MCAQRSIDTGAHVINLNRATVIRRYVATELKGHKDDVYMCQWNPTLDFLASGSKDATARLWDLSVDTNTLSDKRIACHRTKELVTNDVISLDWKLDGQLLATGSYDGYVRIWTNGGVLLKMNKIGAHNGPIFAVKWNNAGNYILSGGADKVVTVWDAGSMLCQQKFACHKEPIWNVDWQTNTSFASCCKGGAIHVCELDPEAPTLTFKGHVGDVNEVQWSPDRGVLASCSNDMTVKIWSIKQNTWLYNFQEHSGKVLSLNWRPDSSFVASGSADSTIKLWDANGGKCVRTLSTHKGDIESLAFSPDGKYLASGHDKYVFVWDSDTYQLVCSYQAPSDIYSVSWNHRGSRVAASGKNGSVSVLDLRKSNIAK